MYLYNRRRAVTEQQNTFTGYMVEDQSILCKNFDYSKIYRSKQFNEAMRYFDIEDDMTRRVLLSVNEADQNVVMTSLAGKLYKHITEKVDDIDFGTIPTSAGNITKIDNYNELVDCVNIISEILQQYHQDTKPIETISLAIQNMVDRIDFFERAYKLNLEFPIVVYNSIVLAIVGSVSFMISSCIEFIKAPNDEGFEIAIDRTAASKAKGMMLFDDLGKFNKICGDGSFDRAMEYVMAQDSNNFIGSAAFTASSAVVVLGVLLLIIPIIREIIFFFYYAKASVSDYFDAQASILLINAYNVENSTTRDTKEKKKIAAKQKSIADKFKNLSNALKVKLKTGEKKTADESAKLDKQKYKQDEVLENIPDSSNSVLF